MRKYYPWFIVLIFVVVSVPVGCHIFGPSNHSVKDYTQLCADAQAGRVDAIKLAVRNDRAALKARDWDEATLLHLTIGQNHKELAIYLLDEGVDVDARTTDRLTPLHMAAQNGNI